MPVRRHRLPIATRASRLISWSPLLFLAAKITCCCWCKVSLLSLVFGVRIGRLKRNFSKSLLPPGPLHGGHGQSIFPEQRALSLAARRDVPRSAAYACEPTHRRGRGYCHPQERPWARE